MAKHDLRCMQFVDSACTLIQKVSNSFSQNAKGYKLLPAKFQKIRENKSVLHAVLRYSVTLWQFAKRAQITFGAVAKGNLLPF